MQLELIAPHADMLSVHSVMELEGAFGGDADTLVIFESESEDFAALGPTQASRSGICATRHRR